jgi:hypothetical protein
MNDWWSKQEWPCVCQGTDPWIHSHYDYNQHPCARCECAGYRPRIPEAVGIRILLGPEMTNEQAATILLGPEPMRPVQPPEDFRNEYERYCREACGAKPGAQLLCADCLHNRDLVERLKATQARKLTEVYQVIGWDSMASSWGDTYLDKVFWTMEKALQRCIELNVNAPLHQPRAHVRTVVVED